jgi:hypothetical protein
VCFARVVAAKIVSSLTTGSHGILRSHIGTSYDPTLRVEFIRTGDFLAKNETKHDFYDDGAYEISHHRSLLSWNSGKISMRHGADELRTLCH